MKTWLVVPAISKRGLQFSDLKLYHWSAQVRSATLYFSTETPAAWIKSEQKTVTNLQFDIILFYFKVST